MALLRAWVHLHGKRLSPDKLRLAPVSSAFGGCFHRRQLSITGSRSSEWEEAQEWLAKHGYTKEQAAAVLGGLDSIPGMKPSVATLGMLGAEGIKAFLASVEMQNRSQGAQRTVRILVHHHRLDFELPMRDGESLMDVAKSQEGQQLLGEYLECACGGNASCATCHVYVDERYFEKLGEVPGNEQDMIDLAFEPKNTSRLGCQVKMREDLDGLTVSIPQGCNNFWS